MLETAIALIVGFALGYGVREWLSPPKAPSGATTAASGFWDITLSGMTRFAQVARCAPAPARCRHRPAGRGAYAICALPDLCVGITRQWSARCGGAAPETKGRRLNRIQSAENPVSETRNDLMRFGVSAHFPVAPGAPPLARACWIGQTTYWFDRCCPEGHPMKPMGETT